MNDVELRQEAYAAADKAALIYFADRSKTGVAFKAYQTAFVKAYIKAAHESDKRHPPVN